ncbi:MAG: GGDEF domain-containing protein [Anaeromyxobacter sp.]
MVPRILLAEDGKAVVEVVERGAALAGAHVDAVPLSQAATRLAPEHDAAIVHGAGPGDALIAAMRAAHPDLPIVALFYDDDDATGAGPGAASADGSLVGPLTLPAVAGIVRLALRLREARLAFGDRELAARPPAPPPPVADLAADAAAATANGRGGPDAEASAGPAAQPAGGNQGLELLKRLIVLEVKRSRRYKLPVSIAIVALDGWPERAAELTASDRQTTLASVLGTVAGALRDIDMVVPFPDDRLVALLPHTDRAGALVVAGRIVSRIRNLAGALPLTASAGIATHDGDGDGQISFASLVKRASGALTRARGAGGDQALAGDPPKRKERIVIG